MRSKKHKIMAWGEGKLHRHLVNFNRKETTFRDCRLAFAHLRNYFWLHISKDYGLKECRLTEQ